MLYLFHGLFQKTKLSSVFQHSVILLQLTDLCRGQSWGVGSSQTVVALIGDDVTLPCHLEPAVDVFFKSVEWGRPDLEPRFVHVWYEGSNLLNNQNPSYKGRTSVSAEKLRHGDLSLTLSAVKHSDNGLYRCYFPQLSKETNVRLIVGSVSSAFITRVTSNNGLLVVQCKSEGWYPEPEVMWLDGEGNPLSAGPTESLRGPDGLFTVSSRVTVEKTNRDSFTCRVQQNAINQIRETHIQMSAEINNSSSAARITVILAVSCICITAVCFVLWKMRQVKTELNELKEEDECKKQQDQLLTGNPNNDQVENTLEEHRKIMDKLEDQRQTMETLVEEQKKNLESLMKELKDQAKSMEKNVEETERRFEAAKKVAEQDKVEGIYKMKETVLWAKKKLQERKQEDNQLITNVQELHHKTDLLHHNLKTKMSPEEKK